MGLEPMTSPLPRECSTTELHQPSYYFIADAAVSTRPALRKSPTTTTSPAASCPAPSSARPAPQAPQAQPAPLPAAHSQREQNSSRPALPNYYLLSTHCTSKNGAQGRIRTFVATSAADLQSAAINHSATCAHPACMPCNLQQSPAQSTAATSALGLPIQVCAGRHCMAGTTSRYNQTLQIPFTAGKKLELAKGFEPPTA